MVRSALHIHSWIFFSPSTRISGQILYTWSPPSSHTSAPSKVATPNYPCSKPLMINADSIVMNSEMMVVFGDI